MLDRRHIPARMLGAAVAAGLLAAAFTGPAAAAPASAAADADTGTHCVSRALPAGSTATDVPVRCFTTFADAIAHATGGAVRLPADATRVTQRQLDAGAAQVDALRPDGVGAAFLPMATVVLGISYKRTNYNGDTWTHTGSYGCDSDPDVDWQNAGPWSGSWDNEISSAEGFSSCTGRYWANSGFWGASITTNWSDGVMNNETSSIQWS